MVTPITPRSSYEVIKGPGNVYGFRPEWVERRKIWNRQTKPFNLELPYFFSERRINEVWDGDGVDYVDVANSILLRPKNDLSQRLYNATYSSFMEDVRGVQASLGATLGEWKSAQEMIVGRANQLVQGIKCAKRGDFFGLKRVWGKHAGIKPRVRAGGGQVLEYSFGWAPLVSDINSALEVFHNRLPPFRVKKRKAYRSQGEETFNYGSVARDVLLDSFIGWELRAYVDVNNPNTALANQLGLVNLASVAWELTPNSYVIDYFVNVSDFIDSFTDKLGLSLISPAKTEKRVLKTLVTSRWRPNPGGYPPYSPIGWKAQEVYVTRSLEIPGPTLALRLPWRMSLQRASTSIARLLQQLKGK